MKISFHPDAEQELNRAIDYYEDIEPGLGFDLSLEIHATIQRIQEHPKAWAKIDNDIRRSLVRRFPYGVIYFEDKGGILILAVMNLHKEPNYWKDRVT